jgi:hypothetical protein
VTVRGPDTAAALQVAVNDAWYPARAVSGGAAYEIYADQPLAGFLSNPSGRPWPYHRFVHVSDVVAIAGEPGPGPAEEPLRVPLSRSLTWERVHQLSQMPPRDTGTAALLAMVRAAATIRRGTRMVKPLTGGQLAEHLRGRLPSGFCFREYDVAHLRTPADLAILSADSEATQDGAAAFTLTWRAIDPADYEVPGEDYRGLATVPASERVGPVVLGTGFAPSGGHLVPEFVTTDLADVPLPANAQLHAHTSDGGLVPLYIFQPEQRGWIRLAGPQWQHLLDRVPDLPPQNDYVAVPDGAGGWNGTTALVGRFRGQEHEAVADPPREFRVRSRHRAVRFPVEQLVRRVRFCQWRGVRCTVVRDSGRWARVRLTRPDIESISRLGAGGVDRGVYESWAPVAELTGRQDAEFTYDLAPA